MTRYERLRKLKPYTIPSRLHQTPFEEGQQSAYANVYTELKCVIPTKKKRVK